ncbi:MAG: hypothetical protein RLZZ458_2575 [Planctomycetota bacterium]|jgi:hypothetical protein
MITKDTVERIFVSHVADDGKYAEKLRDLIGTVSKATITLSRATESQYPSLLQQLRECSIIVILIGPKTYSSRMVDREIELAIAPRANQPPAGMLGIILPEHGDFSKPYYEPDSVPVRVHDRVLYNYAVLKKWTDEKDKIQAWLSDSMNRRLHLRSTVSNSVVLGLHTQVWDESVDGPHEVLQALEEQE